MTTDTKWTWTILMANGKIFRLKKALSLETLLKYYILAGYQLTEIEAIVRH